VYNRGVDRQDVFGNDHDHARAEDLLAESAVLTGAEVHAFCFMTNHFHALVRCPDGPSAMMQRLQGVYAGWYNHRYDRTGPVFEGRFGSVVVSTDQQLIETSRYIHNNPLDIVPARSLPAYRWSSYGVYLGRRPAPEWLHTDVILAPFGGDPVRYEKFVAESAQEHGRAGDRRPPSVEHIVDAVSSTGGISVEQVLASAPGSRNDARTLVALLAVECRSADTAAVASVLGAAVGTVRTLARRGRVLRESDATFRRFHDRARTFLEAS
jgi:REP element-mobilizing transposase RayT